jgi:Type IV pilin-like G and H, putative
MLERLFFGSTAAGLVGLIFLALCIPVLMPPQMKCSREVRREERQNAALFLRSQAAYYRENGKFAKDLDRLALGTITGKQQTETKYYSYRMFSTDPHKVILTAQPKDPGLKAAIAYNAVTLDSSTNRSSVLMFVCSSDRSNELIPTDFRFIGTKTICPTGYTSLNRDRGFRAFKPEVANIDQSSLRRSSIPPLN